MVSGSNNEDEDRPGGKPHESSQPDRPEWASGLRRLYDSVVDEPIPDSFKDLLSKLDDGR